MLCDLHIHSNNSFDAESPVDEICEAALAENLSVIAITDHCEAPFINKGDDCEFGSFDRQIPQSINDVDNARKKYSSKLKILRGLELGEPMHDPAQTARALDYGDFDFILASVHNLRGMDDFYFMDYENCDFNRLLSDYFDELAETAGFEHFDSLAHLTYPLRYIFEHTGSMPDLSGFSNQIDNIFNILIKNNKALEINVSGLYKPMNVTLPDVELVKRFHDLGGKYITIGTDSHTAKTVGKGIDRGIEVAKLAGFDGCVIYENHKPTFARFESD